MMTDYEVLFETQISGIKLKDCGTMTFLGWLAGKLNGKEQNLPGMSELAMYIKTPPMGKMSDQKKLEIVRLMERVGIKIC